MKILVANLISLQRGKERRGEATGEDGKITCFKTGQQNKIGEGQVLLLLLLLFLLLLLLLLFPSTNMIIRLTLMITVNV